MMGELANLRPDFYRSADNPAKGYLTFDCPICQPKERHRFTIPTLDGGSSTGLNGAKRWALSGSPPDWSTVSLSPSIDLQERCGWHGFITNGEAS